MQETDRIALLLDRYRNETITSAELDELLIWLSNLSEEQSVKLGDKYNTLWEQVKLEREHTDIQPVDWDMMLNRIMHSSALEKNQKNVYPMWRMAAAVAAILLFSAVAIYLMLDTGKKEAIAAVEGRELRLPEQVLPNVNQTILTLPSGRKISLDSIASGNILPGDKESIVKLKDGEITYGKYNEELEPEYHTISVPRGGRPYMVKLTDGSRIWLNAESSLRYPSFFKDGNRTVQLTGEGYFEISTQFTANRKTPFLVQLPDMTIEVLGTHFNVMAYEDEQNIETTLLEGSVKIISGSREAILTPGKQAQRSSEGKLNMVPADTSLVTAWKNGYFQFDKANIKALLRQVGRWYDLQIEYQGDVSADLFSGKIERALPLSAVLKFLKSSQVAVRVEGKKLIIMPDGEKK